MDFDPSWLLIGLPVAFALGWLASRLDLRQWKRDQADSPRAYYKGLNLLLNEQQDQAVDAFIEAVQGDPDSAELHFALGKLFRRRGDFERAVRVHRHLLERGDLGAEGRTRAQLALAQDYFKAGLFDRAEQAWTALLGTDFDDEARLALLSLYERSRSWPQAAAMARQLEGRGLGQFAIRLAHYECEVAMDADAEGRPEEAAAALARAREAAPTAPRPWLHTGQRCLRDGDPLGAMQAWDTLRAYAPADFARVAVDYAGAALAGGRADDARQVLDEALAQQPSIELVHARDRLDADRPAAERLPRVVAQLEAQPSLAAARLLLELAQSAGGLDRMLDGGDGGLAQRGRAAVARVLEQAARPMERYRCANCGFEARRHFWQCPGCLAWDSLSTPRPDGT